MTSSKEQNRVGRACCGMRRPSASALAMAGGSADMTARWHLPRWNCCKTLSKLSRNPRITGFLKAFSISSTRLPLPRSTPSSFRAMRTPRTSSSAPGAASSGWKIRMREWPHRTRSSMKARSMTRSCGTRFASSMPCPICSARLLCMSSTPWIMFASSSFSNSSCCNVRIMALSSCRGWSSASWPRTRSNISASGQTTGSTSTRASCTTGTMRAASFSWFGPVKIADGMISPKSSTTVTDSNTASQDGTSRSRNKGNASFAAALMRSSVTSK
mmetsp:Transcript_77330/g.236696  ORF Transcript_77330/g.236696 Transcript_77330/m.236696 type:complete len:272 (+) Transcript_77330:96-911(+)